MAAAALVGLLLLSAISTADKFDEENYGVKVRQAHVEFYEDNRWRVVQTPDSVFPNGVFFLVEHPRMNGTDSTL